MSTNKKTLIDGDFQVGTGHLIVDTENNYVGFNNATPQNKIDVQIGARTGTHSTGKPLYVTGVTSTTGAEFVSDDGTAGIGIGSSNIFATGANQNITITPDGTGAVGIKTATPNPSGETFDLWVQGDTKITGNVTAGYIFGDGSALTNISGTQWISSSEDIYFLNNTGSGEGKVGIGKTVPEYKLDILDSDKPTIRVKSTSTGDGDALLILDSSATGESDIDFKHDGSLNWRIRTGDAAPSGTTFQLNNANDSNVLTIQQNGNVGIGTDLPNVPLEVNKSAGGEILRLTTSTGTLYAGADADPPWFGTSSDDHLRLMTNGSEKIRIESGGNVGIGTVDPSNLLHVYKANNDETSGILIEKASGQIPTSAALFFGVASTTETNNRGIPKAAIFYERNLVNGRGDLKFCNDEIDDTNPVSTAASDTRMIIKNSGEVGIGTVSPDTKLHLYATGSGNVLDFKMSGSWSSGDYYRIIGFNADKQIQFNYTDGMWLSDNNSIRFGCGGTKATSGVYSERMRITNGGNVGIGTTSPTAQLHISSGNSGDCVLKIEADEDNNLETDNPRIEFISDGGYNTALVGAGQMPFENSNDNALVLAGLQMKFYTGVQDFTDSTNMTEKMRILANGNVGIGTTSPSGVLHVVDSSANSSWNKLLVRPTTLWGDGVSTPAEDGGGPYRYMTMANIMLQNPHVCGSTVGQNAHIRLGRGGGVSTGEWWDLATRTDNKFHICKGAVATTGIVIDTGGLVGIGTEYPTEKLDIAGNLKINGVTMSKPPRVIYLKDYRSGCPPGWGAFTNIMSYNLSLSRYAYVYASVTTILVYHTRADSYIYFGGTLMQNHLTASDNTSWNPVNITAGGFLGPGTHTISFRCNVANVVGCGPDWGGMQILVFET